MCMQGAWRVYGGCIQVEWGVYAGCKEGVWRVYGGYLLVASRVYAGCMWVVWRVHAGCMEGAWRVYGECMVGACEDSEGRQKNQTNVIIYLILPCIYDIPPGPQPLSQVSRIISTVALVFVPRLPPAGDDMTKDRLFVASADADNGILHGIRLSCTA